MAEWKNDLFSLCPMGKCEKWPILTREILFSPTSLCAVKMRPSVIESLPYSNTTQEWREPWQNAFHSRPPTRPLPAGAVMLLKGVDGIWESCVLWYEFGSERDHYLARLWLASDSFAEKLPAFTHTAGEALKAPCYIRLKWRMQHKSPEPWPWLWLNAHTGPFPWGMSWLELINPVLALLSHWHWKSAHWTGIAEYLEW